MLHTGERTIREPGRGSSRTWEIGCNWDEDPGLMPYLFQGLTGRAATRSRCLGLPI